MKYLVVIIIQITLVVLCLIGKIEPKYYDLVAYTNVSLVVFLAITNQNLKK